MYDVAAMSDMIPVNALTLLIKPTAINKANNEFIFTIGFLDKANFHVFYIV